MDDKRDFETFIVQLAENMRYSARNLPDPNVMSEFDEESLPEELKMFAYVERFLRRKAKPIATITGIETDALPLAGKMTDAQITFIYDEMARLLSAYGFYADFPKGLPTELKYSLLRKTWDSKFVYTGDDMTFFEFCDYEPARCPYPESFCRCKGLDDFNDFENLDGDDLVF